LGNLLRAVALLIFTMIVFILIIWLATIGTVISTLVAVALAIILGFIFMCADVYEWW